MRKFVFSVVCPALAGLSLALAAAAPAQAATTLWTARESGGHVVMEDWPIGPQGGTAGAFSLEQTSGNYLHAGNFLGFQFAADGTMWTARESGGKVVMEDWPIGPQGGTAGAFVLEQTSGNYLYAENFLGFQFAEDGTMWTARESGGKVVMEDWPIGAQGGTAGAFVLEQTSGNYLFAENFLGFQFAPDGTMWTARESGGKVVMEDWPIGAQGGTAGAFVLEQTSGNYLYAENFLGFQFAEDGTMWTARESGGKVVMEDWPIGPQGGTAGAFVLEQTSGNYLYAENFLGFQFVTTPDPGSAVPEPATWAMLIVGFGLVGGSLRRARGRSAGGDRREVSSGDAAVLRARA